MAVEGRCKVKTLLLSEIFPPKTGGSGRWFWEIYSRLPGDGVTVAAGRDSRAEAFDRGHDLRVVRVPLSMRRWGLRSVAGLRGYAAAYRAVRRVVRQNRIEQVHCGRLLPEGWIAWMLKKSCGLPYICYVHGEETNYGVASRELAWMMRRVIRGADYLIANSRNTARVLGDGWDVPDGKIKILHPGVDVQRFVPAARDEAVRAELGWDARPVVLTVGRLQRRKGQDQMIRAWGRIRQAVPDVLYAIVGDGDDREHLRRLIDEHDVADHVQMLGEIDDERMIQCLQQCDLFALPNRDVDGDFEGFGMVLLEAQACGRPVLAGDSGGTSETMRVGETGRIVPCDHPDPLADAVIELLGDEDIRQQMGQAARDWVTERFGWESLSRQAAALFCGEPSPCAADTGVGKSLIAAGSVTSNVRSECEE
ncbi:MAG: glycosyltransferase family 4 protein [Planctomycetes bacterium]|nr:glycosyltransferase family 4 protein [Planctomycetota bacterium]